MDNIKALSVRARTVVMAVMTTVLTLVTVASPADVAAQ